MDVEKILSGNTMTGQTLQDYARFGGGTKKFRSVFENAMQSLASPAQLHLSDDEGKVLGAAAGSDYSITVYKPFDFSETAPLYTIRMWDEAGDMKELKLDPRTIDPRNSDFAEMYAYSCYLSDTGANDDSPATFAKLTSDYRMSEFDTAEKRDWIELAEMSMQSHYRAGNLKDYMDIRMFIEAVNSQKA